MVFRKKSDWTVEKIRVMIEEGKSLQEIADTFNLSRQRIKQISQRHKLPNTVEVKSRIRAEKHFDKWGMKDNSDLYAACREKFRAKKASAKLRGVLWTLTFGELDWPTHCPILGLELDYFAETRSENSPSFDRIDPSRGYEAGNVRVLSWRANRIKNDGSASEHRLIAAYLEKLSEGQ